MSQPSEPPFDLSSVDVILLDQGETFMFENDRFGPEEDYAATYRRVGGTHLSDEEAQRLVSDTFNALTEAYDDGLHDDVYPTVREIVADLDSSIPEPDLDLIDDTIAEHEIGTISEARRQTIHALSATHRLGIISNVWGQPARFEHNLQNTGIFDCFEHIVWSSAHHAIKPSPRLYQIALDYWQVAPANILYVGNDLKRDVGGSTSVGMKSVWIDVHLTGLPDTGPQPDAVIHDLVELTSGNPE